MERYPTINNRSYYPSLDGLRGIAIMLVLLYHNFKFIGFFNIGWLGVDLFFVISGFLITDILLQIRKSINWLPKFYFRRILRIFPLYYSCLIFFLYILPFFLGQKLNVTYYKQNQIWLWLNLQNWLYIKDTSNKSDILHHFWSLAVEEQFYFLWPLVVLSFNNPKRLLQIIINLFLVLIFARLTLYLFKFNGPTIYSLYIFSRIDGLCIGSSLALIMFINKTWLSVNVKKIIFWTLLINLLYFLIRYVLCLTIPYFILLGYPTLALSFGVIVFFAVNYKVPKFPLTHPILKSLGKISYGVYLLHWPIYCLLFSAFVSFFKNFISESNNIAEVLAAFSCSVISIAISMISYQTIEKYFLHLKPRYT